MKKGNRLERTVEDLRTHFNIQYFDNSAASAVLISWIHSLKKLIILGIFLQSIATFDLDIQTVHHVTGINYEEELLTSQLQPAG